MGKSTDMNPMPFHRRVPKDEFDRLAVDARRQEAFPPRGPEYHFKDQRHFGYENLTTGECVIFDWPDRQALL